ncbi:restriction endonuclease subunit S [Enterococcus cecorum]|uniref:restriction endonuclease subunit S n=1 Tax=Enterococcus cecorum TaxID=44008 RepID=UPI002ACAF157|nr:restriction endonuclease subunit S [Enterococcus cecorum]MDZ5508524.1 restriction endonuclease subunit S [Enterococcus cecorum]
MNEKKKMQPKVRFREFTGENASDWEQRKLGEVFSETISYVDPKLEDLELWSVTTENGLVPKESRYNRQFLVKKTDKFKKIFPNEIVYNPMNMTLGSIGFNNLNKVVAVSGYYVTMKLKLGFNSMYFAAWLPSNKAIRLYKIFATGSLTERQRIQFSTLKDIKTCIPLESEQRIIGQFFEKLEDLITLHQRKLEQLEQLKNTLLSKMFPKSGTNIPEIRFSGFTDAWKQRKLKEMLEERNELILESNDYPLMSFVQGKGVIPKSNRYDRSFLVKNDKKKYKKTELNDFIYSSNNLETGSIGFNKTGNAVISPVYSIFKSKNKLESRFIAIISRRKDFIAKMLKFRQGVVYGQWKIDEDDFLNISVSTPNIETQKYIIDLFIIIDNYIAIHQRKLEQLKNLKQTLLNKMFV